MKLLCHRYKKEDQTQRFSSWLNSKMAGQYCSTGQQMRIIDSSWQIIALFENLTFLVRENITTTSFVSLHWKLRNGMSFPKNCGRRFLRNTCIQIILTFQAFYTFKLCLSIPFDTGIFVLKRSATYIYRGSKKTTGVIHRLSILEMKDRKNFKKGLILIEDLTVIENEKNVECTKCPLGSAFKSVAF